MANNDFTNMKDLFKYLEQQAKLTLQQDESNVKNVVVTEFIESIEENIYDAYHSPATANPYKRQRERDGLIDRDNFRIEPTSDGVAISSSRQGVDGNGNTIDVMEVLEGNAPWGVEDVWGYGFSEPRHAVEPVRDKLRNSRHLTQAMKLDLKNKGFRIE